MTHPEAPPLGPSREERKSAGTWRVVLEVRTPEFQDPRIPEPQDRRVSSALCVSPPPIERVVVQDLARPPLLGLMPQIEHVRGNGRSTSTLCASCGRAGVHERTGSLIV